MYIKSVHIRNFKGYKKFDLELNEGMNILVGDNEAKKSTILESINLALTGVMEGKYLNIENLNDFLFNKDIVTDFQKSLAEGVKLDPPSIIIELHFSEEASSDYEGAENILGVRSKGIYYRIGLRQEYMEAYETLKPEDLRSLPLELYTIELKRFSGQEQSRAFLPIKNSYIDTSSNSANASDQTISKILKDKLDKSEKIKANQFYRGIRDTYKTHPIHDELNKHVDYKGATISIDPSSKNSWDSHLSIYVKDIPFSYIGRGMQTILKTNVSLLSKKTENADLVLIEEPENHLSHATLNVLVQMIEDHCKDKQIIITSHSSFITNKLGLNNLILINNELPLLFRDLEISTQEFFKKLPGYDTLRLLLCKTVILVEGDADELLIQRAYKDIHEILPISKGVDVISVNNTFDRFLQLAKPLKIRAALVIDVDNKLEHRKSIERDLSGFENIKVFYEENKAYTGTLEKYNNNTLEPLLLAYNNRSLLNQIFGTDHETDDELLAYMKDNKTKCALAIFESDKKITYPKYILDAIVFIS